MTAASPAGSVSSTCRHGSWFRADFEQNSLSLDQVTALFDGQRVIGPARAIPIN